MLGFLGSLFSDLIFFILHVTGSGSFPNPLSAKEERECLEDMKSGNPSLRRAARNRLIEHNLRLVAHIIKNRSSKRRNFLVCRRTSRIGKYRQVTLFFYVIKKQKTSSTQKKYCGWLLVFFDRFSPNGSKRGSAMGCHGWPDVSYCNPLAWGVRCALEMFHKILAMNIPSLTAKSTSPW